VRPNAAARRAPGPTSSLDLFAGRLSRADDRPAPTPPRSRRRRCGGAAERPVFTRLPSRAMTWLWLLVRRASGPV